jgi:hypothetical protein
MPLIIPANTISGGYEVANSLRFNDGSSDYLNKTNGTPTNNDICTISLWTKFSQIATDSAILSQHTDSNNRFQLSYPSSGYLSLLQKTSGSTEISIATDRLFRDASAWYHIVLAIDTTQGTASNRVKLYINGVQETSFQTETYPSQNTDIRFNSSSLVQEIGRVTASDYYDGYMAEVCFIDGQQLDPTSFGEFDEDTNIWKPIDVSGLTFGTNGFYLDFENSGSLGADVSGNGNNFTVNNLTSIDQSTDTCTNNFATLNPLDFGVIAPAFSNGNLQYVSSGSGVGANSGNRATFGFSTGKWYWEIKRNDNNASYFGATNSDISVWFNSNGALSGGFYGVTASGDKFVNGSLTGSVFSAMSSGDIGMFAYDLDNNYFYFGVNGTWVTSGDPESGSSGTGALGTLASGTYQPSLCNGNYGVSTDMSLNFGNPPFSISSSNTDGNGYGNFEYAVPNGYYSLNSKNLAEYG